MKRTRSTALSLSKVLKKDDFPTISPSDSAAFVEKLQLNMLRIQQGLWHNKQRALILFEGFDAAGKGGSIRRLTEKLDPRGVRVTPFGPPTEDEQGRHYLYRFWRALPSRGQIAVFDRSWYGRVLVERVDKLTKPTRWRHAFKEINKFEKILTDDGIDIVKIFLAISKDEQLRRFEARIKDPYKQWKLTSADIQARSRWDDYVEAADEMLTKTSAKVAPWHLIAANNKDYTRSKVLEIVTKDLRKHFDWMEKAAYRHQAIKLEKALKRAEKQ